MNNKLKIFSCNLGFFLNRVSLITAIISIIGIVFAIVFTDRYFSQQLYIRVIFFISTMITVIERLLNIICSGNDEKKKEKVTDSIAWINVLILSMSTLISEEIFFKMVLISSSIAIILLISYHTNNN